jgi:signal peptidase I
VIFDYVDKPVFFAFLILLMVGLRIILSNNRKIEVKRTIIIAEDGDGDGGADDAAVLRLDYDLPADTDMTYPGPSYIVKPRGWRGLFIDFLDAASIAIALVFLIIQPFIVEPFFIPSKSMHPTLQIGDRVLVTKFNYNFRIPNRGEIVIFHAPGIALQLNNEKYDPGKQVEFVKRVIGLPGDHIQISPEKGVCVNSISLKEPYIHDINIDYTFPPSPYEDTSYLTPIEQRAFKVISDNVIHGEYIVPPGHLFVLGDNRPVSLDSHRWGSVPLTDVIGKPVSIILREGKVKWFMPVK